MFLYLTGVMNSLAEYNTNNLLYRAMPMSFPHTLLPETHADLLTMVATKMDVFHQDLIAMQATQEKMADAIGKLAVIEERQSTTIDAVNRSFKAIERLEDEKKELEKRVRTLENENITNTKTSKWVESGIIGAVVLLALYVAKKTGFG